ncbi:ubiquitinyl hydrolase 1 [Agyrium rufum]|nr:ubiquitinyl hydrolase 1 [Agyrium rufum]
MSKPQEHTSGSDALSTTTTAPPREKHFIPLENNPQVMTTMMRNLGLSTSLSFCDVYSLTDPDLLSFIPRPAYALLLVFPVSSAYTTFRTKEDASREEYTGKGEGEEVLWFKQTIRNACGLMGLIHAVCNGRAREKIAVHLPLEKSKCRTYRSLFAEPNSPLSQFIQSTTPLPPKERAALLYDSPTFESAHAIAATQGSSAAPDAYDEVDLHYVTFVKSKEGNLWEMDGTRKGPILRGKLAADEDALSEKALDLGPKSFLKREEEVGGGSELRFSIVALVEGEGFDD